MRATVLCMARIVLPCHFRGRNTSALTVPFRQNLSLSLFMGSQSKLFMGSFTQSFTQTKLFMGSNNVSSLPALVKKVSSTNRKDRMDALKTLRSIVDHIDNDDDDNDDDNDDAAADDDKVDLRETMVFFLLSYL